MATPETNNTDLAAEILWKSADALRGQIDAAEYKHVVLGLLFLKYISDSFEARRDELKAELEADGITGPQLESLLETATSTPPSGSSGCRPRRAGRTSRTRPRGPTSPR
jgi:type I restriction enzyme M protein